jgi:SAM-dependent methyltransferase
MDKNTTIAADAYALMAERYDALAPAKPHNGLYERPATHALLGSVDGLMVLDAGCGSGIGSEMLARAGAKITGIDASPEMLELANTRCKDLDAIFTQADLSLPLDFLNGGDFDKIICSLALDYLPDLSPVFSELARVTKPGGNFVFSMSHPMRDWGDERTRGEKPYFETNLWGCHWKGFGHPRPFVQSFRRPLMHILNPLIKNGWSLEQIVEPLPLAQMKEQDADLFAELSREPSFICIRAKRAL